MWPQYTPDPLPLWLAKQRHAEFIHEAERYRLAKAAVQHRLASAHTRGPVNAPATRLLNRIRGGIGRWFADVRRAFYGPEAPCTDPCPDRAPF